MRRADRLALTAALACLAACGAVREPVIARGWDASRADHPLTRGECVALALDFAPTAAAWRARLDAARARLDAAGRLPNPTLGVEWEDFGLSPHAETALQTTMPLGVALADLFSRGAREGIADHELAAAEADLLTERRKLALAVCTAYDGLVAARETFRLTRELVGIAGRAREAVARRVAVGLDAPIHEDRAAAELARLETRLAAEDIDVGGREMALAFALGFERPVPIELADHVLPDQGPPAVDVESLLGEAATSRPELRAAAERYAAALERADLQASPVRFLPHLGAGPRSNGGHLFGVASLEVELPLFDSGSAARAESEAELLGAAAELRATAHAITEEIVTAATRVEQAESFLKRHALPMADRYLRLRDSAERLFAAGELEFDSMLDLFRAEVDARQEALRARANLAEVSWPLAVDRWLRDRAAGVEETAPDPQRVR